MANNLGFIGTLAAVMASAPLGMAGCALEASAAAETTATVQSAIGETSCETATKSADGTWGIESVSAGNVYDPAGCPDQYLVGWGSLPSGHNALADVFWEGALPTPSNCGDSHMSLVCYSETLGGWNTPIVELLDGAWNGSSCSFVASGPPFTCPLTGDQKNRTAARAWVRTCSGSGVCTQSKRRVGIRATLN